MSRVGGRDLDQGLELGLDQDHERAWWGLVLEQGLDQDHERAWWGLVLEQGLERGWGAGEWVSSYT